MQQLFSKSSSVSSFVHNCHRVLGDTSVAKKKCDKWNHEGQWLLKTPSPLMSGAMCPVDGLRNFTDEAESIIGQWSHFWDLERVYLMEKSPQSLLKIPYLRELLRTAKSVKFLVIIKHPATLNIATPREFGWKYYNDAASKISLINERGEKVNQKNIKRIINVADMKTNLQHFDHFMTRNNCVNKSRTSPCEMGWLPALELLHKQLDTSPTDDTRIIRYEQFAGGYKLCQKIFSWVFESESGSGRDDNSFNRALQEVCETVFVRSQKKTAGVSKSLQRQRGVRGKTLQRGKRATKERRLSVHPSPNRSATAYDASSDSGSDIQGRELRLHTVSNKVTDSFIFLPHLVSATGQSRLVEFNEMFSRSSAQNLNGMQKMQLSSCPWTEPTSAARLDDPRVCSSREWYRAMERRLGKFGYSLEAFNKSPKMRRGNSSSVFARWEL